MSVSIPRLPRKWIYDLVGEGQRNRDGSYRQKLLREALPGEEVMLVREPNNSHDSNAILVIAKGNGLGLGYIAREEAAVLAPALDAGVSVKSRIHELTGGVDTAPSFGCRICVVESSKPFREIAELRPEQIYYAHAPAWRQQHQDRTRKKTKVRSNGLIAKLVSSLFR